MSFFALLYTVHTIHEYNRVCVPNVLLETHNEKMETCLRNGDNDEDAKPAARNVGHSRPREAAYWRVLNQLIRKVLRHWSARNTSADPGLWCQCNLEENRPRGRYKRHQEVLQRKETRVSDEMGSQLTAAFNSCEQRKHRFSCKNWSSRKVNRENMLTDRNRNYYKAKFI